MDRRIDLALLWSHGGWTAAVLDPPGGGRTLVGGYAQLLRRFELWREGLAWEPGGRTGGVFAVASAVLRWTLGPTPPAGLLGIGAWHHTAGTAAGTPATAPGRAGGAGVSGLYGLAGQRLFELPGSPAAGLFAFARAGLTPDGGAAVSTFGALGLVLRDFAPGRHDVAGLGLSRVGLPVSSHALRAGAHETVLEAFARAQLAPALQIQPDLQYTFAPGGDLPDSLAFGLRLMAAL